MKTRRQIYMDEYVKNKELYMNVYKTYIVLKVLKREMKAVKRKKEEWDWNIEREEGIMEEGKWEIKGEKKHYYYKEKKVVEMSKEEEHYVDYIIKRFFKELKKTYKEVKYVYTIECSNWVRVHILCSLKYTEEFHSWVWIKWAKIKGIKVTPQYVYVKRITYGSTDILMVFINKGAVEVGFSSDIFRMLDEKYKEYVILEEEKPN